MTQETIYNLSVLTGLGCIGWGTALISIPAALITVGILMIALALASACLSRRG